MTVLTATSGRRQHDVATLKDSKKRGPLAGFSTAQRILSDQPRDTYEQKLHTLM
jgi:hypothetical protein